MRKFDHLTCQFRDIVVVGGGGGGGRWFNEEKVALTCRCHDIVVVRITVCL